jgi:lipoprotein NlpD
MNADARLILSYRAASVSLIVLLAGCASHRPAPVSEARTATPQQGAPIVSSTPKPMPEPVTPPKPLASDDKVHVIQKGDTLISIALANGLDYRELALWNNIDNPNVIKLGEALRLTPPGVFTAPLAPVAAMPKPGDVIATPLITTPAPVNAAPNVNTDKFKVEPKGGKVPYSDAAFAKANANADAGAPITGTPLPPVAPIVTTSATTPPAVLPPSASSVDKTEWAWPVHPAPTAGKFTAFSELSKGIDIPGTRKSPVLAAAAGKVIYAGSSLRGYGRLIIIRHTNQDWSSAYAHNEKILVEEGQQVKKGEKIAEMGDSDADSVKLHFEIRKNGKPVDPVKWLGN